MITLPPQVWCNNIRIWVYWESDWPYVCCVFRRARQWWCIKLKVLWLLCWWGQPVHTSGKGGGSNRMIVGWIRYLCYLIQVVQVIRIPQQWTMAFEVSKLAITRDYFANPRIKIWLEAYRNSYLHFVDPWAAVAVYTDRQTDRHTNTLPYTSLAHAHRGIMINLYL